MNNKKQPKVQYGVKSSKGEPVWYAEPRNTPEQKENIIVDAAIMLSLPILFGLITLILGG